jgi:hypothetical protein
MNIFVENYLDELAQETGVSKLSATATKQMFGDRITRSGLWPERPPDLILVLFLYEEP